MLVLSRKAGQDLVIGDNIRVTINKISGNRVTLGIEAPEDVRIVRGELEKIVRSFEIEVDLDGDATAGLVLESGHSVAGVGQPQF